MVLNLDNMRKNVGAFLVALGVIILLMLVFNLTEYINDFTNNPIHDYIVGTEKVIEPITFGSTEIMLPSSILNIAALFLGIMLLRIWLEIGISLINTGRKLITDDIENLKDILNKIIAEKER